MGKKSSKRKHLTKAGRNRQRASDSLRPCPWDHGPDTVAARADTIKEPAKFRDPDTGQEVNPNGVTRRRRRDQIEKLWQIGKLSDRQYDAAKTLRERFLAMQKSAPAIKEIQVDAQPDFGAIEARRIDNVSRFHAAARFVPSKAGPIVDQVVFMNLALSSGIGKGESRNTVLMRRTALLADALNSVADGVGIA